MLKDATKVELKARLVVGPRLDTCRTKLQQSVASPTTDTVPTYRRTRRTMNLEKRLWIEWPPDFGIR